MKRCTWRKWSLMTSLGRAKENDDILLLQSEKHGSQMNNQLKEPLKWQSKRSQRTTFRCVPIYKGVDQWPALAVVSCGQFQPISFQGTDNLALSGHTHGQRPLVVTTGERVQRGTAWSPGVKQHQQSQVWKRQWQSHILSDKWIIECKVKLTGKFQ